MSFKRLILTMAIITSILVRTDVNEGELDINKQ